MKQSILSINIVAVVLVVATMLFVPLASADNSIDGYTNSTTMGRGPGNGQGGNYNDANGDGVCDNYIDANGDGVCDNCTNTPPRNGTGNQNGQRGGGRGGRR